MPPEVQRYCGVTVGDQGSGGQFWPIPPVDLDEATRIAKNRLHARRVQPEVRAAKNEILERHDSRTNSGSKAIGRKSTKTTTQTSFDF